MHEIPRRDLALLMIAVGPTGETTTGLGGITRLQKLLFLLDKEESIAPAGEGFEFSPYKAGPYSARLYDDLELLENLGLLESEATAEATEPEAAEVDVLTFEELMGDDAEATSTHCSYDGARASDAYEERRYVISDKGKERVEALLKRAEYQPVVEGIRRIRSKYGDLSLTDLLYYIYTKYPETATESEIRDRILRRTYRT